MTQKIWDADGRLRSAAQSPGLKTSGDYSGLYRQANASAAPVENSLTGEDAQAHLEKIKREQLNEGNYFDGYLAGRQIGSDSILIGEHSTLGLCVYRDKPSTFSHGRIEVLPDGGPKRVVLKREEFFPYLAIESISPESIESVCSNYRNTCMLADRQGR